MRGRMGREKRRLITQGISRRLVEALLTVLGEVTSVEVGSTADELDKGGSFELGAASVDS